MHSVKDIITLFPQTPEQIHEQVQAGIAEAKTMIMRIIAIRHEARTYDNTVRAFDAVSGLSLAAVIERIVHIIAMVHPDERMRAAAVAAEAEMSAYRVEALGTNKDLYDALKAYAELRAPSEQLDEEQRYYLKEVLEEYRRAGLDLDAQSRDRICELQKEIALLGTSFQHAIAADTPTITVTRAELAGLSEDFVAALPRTDKGLYVVGVDYPTYYPIMEACSVGSTRKKLYRAFQNCAHPANVSTLQELLRKRAELARILGFKTFAQLNLADCMAQSPEKVKSFLYTLLEKARAKEDEEFKLLFQHLPDSVTIEEGKIKPWDLAYCKAEYKKRYLALDEQVVAEYFPMESTVPALLDIYRTFFNIELEERTSTGLWHEEVRLIEVYTKGHTKLLGYLFLDLHPRPYKYGHACECTIIPAIFSKESVTHAPAVALVIANFPRATATQPALWHREQAVQTFFHEFGHALHDILGRTQHAGTAGTSVKFDFVELPSQMLEGWLSDAQMLKKMSCHYKTGQSLPDELIQTIKTMRTFDSGYWVQRQIFLALLALAYYEEQDARTPYETMQQLVSTISRYVAFDPDTHFYASFGHLAGYAARYYGYLWSQVLAMDLFKEIERYGLLDSAIGEKYIREVIGKGGSQDPNELVRTFLGREPNQSAFLAHLGFAEEPVVKQETVKEVICSIVESVDSMVPEYKKC